MLKQGINNTDMYVLFLGPSLRNESLPEKWHAWVPRLMEENQCHFVLTAKNILVIGTVKKIDDLRRRCQTLCSKALIFAQVLHDEFARQQWLDLYTVSKVCARHGVYFVYGDPKQTKAMYEDDIWQNSSQSSQDCMDEKAGKVGVEERKKKKKSRKADDMMQQVLYM